MKFCFLTLSFFFALACFGQSVSGTVTGNGKPLPFASILIKGTNLGTTANEAGRYRLAVGRGTHTVICQYVGYKGVTTQVNISGDEVLNFELEPQSYNLNNVTVKAGGEDPAYAIIRNAIKKRPEYENEIKKFTAEVYIKGNLKLREYPTKFLGSKVEFDDGQSDDYVDGKDSSKKKMIYLSETLAQYSKNEGSSKIEVVSTRVSGQTNGFGFSAPQIISFYNNNISLGRGINPRGFISPISTSALTYYRYKYEGSFYENGKEISRIRVIPKRKFEPLFSGIINILEDEWRIHSVKLVLLKEQQMQLIDTLTIEQILMPIGKHWVVKQQVLYPAIKIFGFDAHGSFLQVYDKYDLNPVFPKNFFDNTILIFTDSSNKKEKNYWDTVRPIPLQQEEIADYHKKDSIEILKNSPAYLDSIDRNRNKPSVSQLILTGQTFSISKKKTEIAVQPLLDVVTYNTVEGVAVSLSPTITKEFKKNNWLSVQPRLRYGFSNEHINTAVNLKYNPGYKRTTRINLSGGKTIFQFNNSEPVSERTNSIATLWWKENLMKIYEATFVNAGFQQVLKRGFKIGVSVEFQHRMPLENTSFYTWRTVENKFFTPNYPTEITATNLPEHNALNASLVVNWQPGTKYIQFPERTLAIGSPYPSFSLSATKGIPGVLNSSTDYLKWNFSVSQNINLKLGGSLGYNIGAGGFLDNKQSFIPDYKHFTGNVGILASEYLSSFQLASLYQFSTAAPFYRYVHGEYHLNGLISNKIPGFRRLNWFFVVGGNGININQDMWHYEVFFSVENILKVIRVDFIRAFGKNGVVLDGVRVGIPGLLSGKR